MVVFLCIKHITCKVVIITPSSPLNIDKHCCADYFLYLAISRQQAVAARRGYITPSLVVAYQYHLKVLFDLLSAFLCFKLINNSIILSIIFISLHFSYYFPPLVQLPCFAHMTETSVQHSHKVGAHVVECILECCY